MYVSNTVLEDRTETVGGVEKEQYPERKGEKRRERISTRSDR